MILSRTLLSRCSVFMASALFVAACNHTNPTNVQSDSLRASGQVKRVDRSLEIRPGESQEAYFKRIDNWIFDHHPKFETKAARQYKLKSVSGSGDTVTTLVKDPGSNQIGPNFFCIHSNGATTVACPPKYLNVSVDGGQVSFLAGGTRPGTADGVGSSAQFREFQGMAADSKGNCFLAEYADHRIRKITPDGTTTSFVGNINHSAYRDFDNLNWDGQGIQALFGTPFRIVADRQDNLYTYDQTLHSLRKISPDGIVTTLVQPHYTKGSDGSITVDSQPLYQISAMNIGPDGNIYVMDLHYEIDGDGNIASAIWQLKAIKPSGEVVHLPYDSIYSATAIAVDSSNSIYLVSRENINKILRIEQNGTVSDYAGNGQFGFADGPVKDAMFSVIGQLDFEKDGALLIGDLNNHAIRRIPISKSQSLELETPAFSPNSDHSKDTNSVKVTAVGGWTLGIDGHPGTLGGLPVTTTGTMEFPWDGNVNGAGLPDGKYTLRLTLDGQQSNTNATTVDAIIDRQAPDVENLHFRRDPMSGKITISGHLIERGLSGLGTKKPIIKLRGAAVTNVSPDYFDVATGNIAFTASIDGGGSQSGQAYHTLSEGEMPDALVSAVVTNGDDTAGNEMDIDIFPENDRYIKNISLMKNTTYYSENNRVYPLRDGIQFVSGTSTVDENVHYHDYVDYGNINNPQNSIVEYSAEIWRTFEDPHRRWERYPFAKVEFLANRVPNTGGHHHPSMLGAGQFSDFDSASGLWSAFPYQIRDTQSDRSYPQNAPCVAEADKNAIAKVRYLPYGFSGDEKINAKISDGDVGPFFSEPYTINIGLSDFESFSDSSLANFLPQDVHQTLWGKTETVQSLTRALQVWKTLPVTRDYKPYVTGISLPNGGPYDNAIPWCFTMLQYSNDADSSDIGNRNHLFHREGTQVDIAVDSIAKQKFGKSDSAALTLEELQKVYQSPAFRAPFEQAATGNQFFLQIVEYFEGKDFYNWHYQLKNRGASRPTGGAPPTESTRH
ncbi:MAG: hypothetical protein JWM80_2963 [Cyanobacteria bacterium RYN_339]|nr:hypothetical protein [Cyanobacteria bacterium RYN_339]